MTGLALVVCLLGQPGSGAVPAPVRVEAEALREASGLVASRKHPGILWTHNDSGDGPRLFAIREDGTLVATWTLTGALARDWEDIAIGPGPKPGVDYLYIGDIGNNCECRTDLSVYRLEEPDPPATRPAGEIPVREYERFPYRFPDKPANAEALLVDPRDGVLYLVDKVKPNAARLWRFPKPSSAGMSVTLVEEARLNLPVIKPCEASYLVTGGDIAADGSAIVLTTYTHVFMWQRGPKDSLPRAMGGTPSLLLRHGSPDHEAVAFDPRGGGYFIVPEGDHPVLERHTFREAITRPGRPTRTGLIDDFNDGDLVNATLASGLTCFSGRWYASALGAPTLPAPVMVADREAGMPRGMSLHVRLTRTPGATESAGLFVFSGLDWNWSPVDLSASRGLKFRCRLNSPGPIRLRLEGVVGGTWYKGEAAFVREVPVGEGWRTVEIPWSQFAQKPSSCPGPSCVPVFSPSGVFMMAWEVPPSAVDPDLRLDDIELLRSPL